MSSEKTESEATQETKKTQSSATTNNDDKKWGWFQTAILIETTLLSFAVMFIDTVLVPALPAIQEKHPDQAHLIPWILTSYMLVGAVSTPICGGLAELYPKNVVAAIPIVMYVIGLFGAGIFGNNLMALVIFRGFQGFGMPIFIFCYDVIKIEFPTQFVSPILGLVAAMFSIGACIGLVGGAALIDAVDGEYKDVFLILGPFFTVTGIAFLLSSAHFSFKCCKQLGARSRCCNGAKDCTAFGKKLKSFIVNLKRIDWFGTFLVSAGSILFLIGINQSPSWGWGSAKTLCLVILGALIIVAWVLFDIWYKEPLVPMRIMMNRNLFFHTVVAFFSGFDLFSFMQVMPYVLTSPLLSFAYTKQIDVGLLLFPCGMSMLLVAPIIGFISNLVGPALVQSLSLAVGILPYIMLLYRKDNVAQIVGASIVQGVAFGGIFSAQMTFAAATSVNSFFHTIGGAIGPIVVDLLMQDTITIEYPVESSTSTIYVPYDVTKVSAFNKVFMLCSVMMAISVVAALSISGHFQALDKVFKWMQSRHQEKPEIELEDIPKEKELETNTQPSSTSPNAEENV